MTQEDQVLLDHSESGQEYYDDDGEEEDYDEQQEEYQEEEDDGEGITIGEEIQLSHQEVWDDSALIEAWDASVKFYETHHSNPKATGKTTTASESTKRKVRAGQVALERPLPLKRTKLTDGDVEMESGQSASEPGEAIATESDSPVAEHVPSQTSQGPSSSSLDPGVTERKPSFRKADKPSFHHHRQSRLAGDTTTVTKVKSDLASSRASSASRTQKEKTRVSGANTTVPSPVVPASVPPSTRHPPVDAATIAYYQQLGYYYDPSYDTSSAWAAETGGDDGEELNEPQGQGLQEESARDDCSSRANNATSKSNPKTKNRPLTTAGASASSTSTLPQATHLGTGVPPHPYPHGHYGYSPFMPPGAAGALSHGGFGMPGPSTFPPGFPGPGAVPFPLPFAQGPNPFAQGPSPMAAGSHYSHGTIPPQPPLASAHGQPPIPEQFSASGMSDEVLSSMIMSWYYTGYYTGLYHARRR